MSDSRMGLWGLVDSKILKAREGMEEMEIPEHMRDSLESWIFNGRGVGGFLVAVLCNDLSKAVFRADGTNLEALPRYVRFLHNFAPANCWGSPENVNTWTAKGGLSGIHNNV